MDKNGAAQRLFALVDARFSEQKDFAAALEITPSIVSEWRRGRSESFVKEKYISRIAKLLGTSTEYILTGNEASRPLDGDGILETYNSLSAEKQRQAREYLGMLKALQDRT